MSFSCGLASALASDDQKKRAITVLYQLKGLYTGGIVLNYSTRGKEMAAHCGMSTKTLGKYMALLKKWGLVWKCNQQDLCLASSKKVAKVFGTSTKKFYKVAKFKLPVLFHLINSLALQENKEGQVHATKRKIQHQYLAARNGTVNPSHLTLQARKKALKGFELGPGIEAAKKRFVEEAKDWTRKSFSLNPYQTLSRQGVARLFGKKGKTSGKYWIDKLVTLGLVREQKHWIDMGPITPQEVGVLRGLGMDYRFRSYKGRLTRSLPNLITPTPGLWDGF